MSPVAIRDEIGSEPVDTTAPIIPASIWRMSSRWFANIRTRRPICSRWPLVALSTASPTLRHAGVDADERELAAVLVVLDLERERGERLVVADRADDRRRRRRILGVAAATTWSAGDGR